MQCVCVCVCVCVCACVFVCVWDYEGYVFESRKKLKTFQILRQKNLRLLIQKMISIARNLVFYEFLTQDFLQLKIV